jgi:membrane fusion protein, multidrug efflux system
MPWVTARGSRVALGAMALSAGLAGCTSELSGHPPSTHRKAANPPRVVRVTHPESVVDALSYPSSLYVERDVRVAARQSGVIEQVLVERGESVRAGQALAVLETAVARAELQIARQDLLLAENELRRVEPLYEQKIVSMSDFDRAKISRDSAQGRVDLAETTLERCTVKAPFAGKVAERWAVVGMRVEESDSIPLFRIVAADPLRARVDIPEKALRSLKGGDRAWVETSGDAKALSARVAFVGPAVDAASGTLPVIVELAAGEDHLKAGSAIRVRFEAPDGEPQALLKLPREAILPGEGDSEGAARVLVVSGGQASVRKVQVMESRGSSLLLRGGLLPSDRVILGAGLGLAEGDPVQVLEGSP